jgi:hypothetical protein
MTTTKNQNQIDQPAWTYWTPAGLARMHTSDSDNQRRGRPLRVRVVVSRPILGRTYVTYVRACVCSWEQACMHVRALGRGRQQACELQGTHVRTYYAAGRSVYMYKLRYTRVHARYDGPCIRRRCHAKN